MDNEKLYKKHKELIEMSMQEKIETIKIWADLAQSSAKEKYQTLTAVSTLAAALLVMATFNEKLIPLTNLVKWIIIILLLIIPISLWGLLGNLYNTEKVAREKLEEATGSKINYKGFMHIFQDIFPYIITGILTIIIFFIIAIILFKNFCYIR